MSGHRKAERRYRNSAAFGGRAGAVCQVLAHPAVPKEFKDIMAAARKTVPVWKAADLGVNMSRVGPGGRRMQLRDVAIVQRDSRCELVAGETPAEQAERLALRLRELKVI